MAETRIEGDKLCKFHEQDWNYIARIKEYYGFHEDIQAIRFALHYTVAVEPNRAADLLKKLSKKSKKTT